MTQHDPASDCCCQSLLHGPDALLLMTQLKNCVNTVTETSLHEASSRVEVLIRELVIVGYTSIQGNVMSFTMAVKCDPCELLSVKHKTQEYHVQKP